MVFILGIFLGSATVGQAEETINVANSMVLGAGQVAVGTIKVVIEGPPEQKKFYTYMAKRLIRLQPGDLLEKSTVQASIDALKLSHRFSAIHVDSAPGPDGEVVSFTLTPYRTITAIDIQGEYPLFEQDILNRMTVYPGNPYTPEQLASPDRGRDPAV